MTNRKNMMRRQAINVSIKELADLAAELMNQQIRMKKSLGKAGKGIRFDADQRFSVAIINKTDESDTWRIEHL